MTITQAQQSLANYFPLLKAAIPHSLIASESLDKIEEIAQILPSATTSLLGFECPLGTPNASADFAVWLDFPEAGRRILGDRNYLTKLPNTVRSHPVWQQVEAFSTLWNSNDSAIAEKVANLWLEFDVNDTPTLPIPSCFFSPYAIYGTQNQQPTPHEWVTQIAIPSLWGRTVPDSLEQRLFGCINALPPDAYVFQIGMMLSRATNVVRVCIRNISPAQILEYLTQIQWPGAIANLQATLGQLCDRVERIDLAIDIGEEISPKLGLECYLSNQPRVEPRWRLFLDYLTEIGLCVDEKQSGLLAFPGYMSEQHYQECWPTNSKRSPLFGSEYEVVFFKGLNHIKVVFSDEFAVEAKAYVGVKRAFLNKPSIEQILPQQRLTAHQILFPQRSH